MKLQAEAESLIVKKRAMRVGQAGVQKWNLVAASTLGNHEVSSRHRTFLVQEASVHCAIILMWGLLEAKLKTHG